MPVEGMATGVLEARLSNRRGCLVVGIRNLLLGIWYSVFGVGSAGIARLRTRTLARSGCENEMRNSVIPGVYQALSNPGFYAIFFLVDW